MNCFIGGMSGAKPLRTITITRINAAAVERCDDAVATEEPLEISGQTLVGFLRGTRMNVYAGTLAE